MGFHVYMVHILLNYVHPKGFNEEEDLQALLFLHLSSVQVADVAHHIFGMTVVSTIWRCTIIPQITASLSFPMSYKVRCNIAACFKAMCDIQVLGAPAQKMPHAVIMFDEILVEKHPCWDNKTNKILRVCRKHSQDTSLEFTSEEDLKTIWEELGCGKIHLAHKVHLPVHIH